MATAVFFSVGFCLILFAERLVTRGSGIKVASFFQAFRGGFIVAAILLVVDSLPFIDAFPGKPLIFNIVWKSSLYITASLAYQYVKPLIKYLFQGMNLSGAASGALQQFMLPRSWGIEIWVAMVLVAYVTLRELGRRIGPDQMGGMFFARTGKPAKGRYFRDAA